uniref:J domain-containing protein n=1 Tax=Elaeophora elaphi TaxID=1147741 RepID=A0A0R3S1C9_9BILA
MDSTDPYSAVRAVLDKFPTDENAKNSMEQRDMKAQQMHVNIMNTVEQLNSLKSSYNGLMNANRADKEHLLVTLYAMEIDTGRRKLDLKEKEVELEDLQQLSEMRRNIVGEQRKQFELLKISQATNKESWIGNTADDH